jgi:heat shock protein HslJ
MKNFIIATGIVIFAIGLGLSACKQKSPTNQETGAIVIATVDNSRTSVDWQGTYTGTVPCADCQGILTQITLKSDNTFSMQMEYLGKGNQAITFEGAFQWDDAGGIITLSGLEENSMPSSYLVGENKLIQLDMEGNRITGDLASMYELVKINETLVDVRWLLFELIDVDFSTRQFTPDTEPFITFHIEGNRISGNSGCNNFVGTYQMSAGSGLRFSGVASTRRMCLDMTIEDQMNKIFQLVDNFTQVDNNLTLSQGETTLAQFKRE